MVSGAQAEQSCSPSQLCTSRPASQSLRNQGHTIPGSSRLRRRKLIVIVSSTSNWSIQQHRQALSDTQDNLHCRCRSGNRCGYWSPNMLNSSGTFKHQMIIITYSKVTLSMALGAKTLM